MILDHLDALMRETPPLRADVRRDALERHEGDRARVLAIAPVGVVSP